MSKSYVRHFISTCWLHYLLSGNWWRHLSVCILGFKLKIHRHVTVTQYLFVHIYLGYNQLIKYKKEVRFCII